MVWHSCVLCGQDERGDQALCFKHKEAILIFLSRMSCLRSAVDAQLGWPKVVRFSGAHLAGRAPAAGGPVQARQRVPIVGGDLAEG